MFKKVQKSLLFIVQKSLLFNFLFHYDLTPSLSKGEGAKGKKLVRGDTNQVDNDCGACAKATIESITKMLKTKDFFIFVVLLFSLI